LFFSGTHQLLPTLTKL